MGKLTDEQKIEICRKYQTNNYTLNDLAIEFSVVPTSIKSILLKRNIEIINRVYSKYTINKNYFDIIDTEDKAYFLGLLYADGYNSTNRFGIDLQEKDKEILYLFSTYLESNHPITIRKLNDKNKNWQNQYKLCISNTYLCNQLTKLGCIPRKSLVLTFPTEEQVPFYLIRHFIRGMWDGDGSIYVSNNRIGTNITSTYAICNSISDILSTQCYFTGTICKDKRSKHTTSILYLTGSKAITFLRWIYQDSTIYLKRKYEKYLEIEKSF